MANDNLPQVHNDTQQHPVRQGFCDALQRDANWKCLILSLLIYVCIGAITWCRLTHITMVEEVVSWRVYLKSTRILSPCDDGYIKIPMAFMFCLYLVYLAECCWHSNARARVHYNKADIRSVIERVHLMRQSIPIVWWKAVSYHFVRRKKHIVRYRNGEACSSSQVYYERVNSHAAGSVFMFAYCGFKDVSRDLIIDPKGPILKIRFSKGFAFSNVEAAAEYEDQRCRFFSEHERFDDYLEMKEGLDLSCMPHFKEHMVAYPDADNLPWYSKRKVYWVLSLLLLSWPLRMICEYNTAYVHYRITKLFGTNYESSSPCRESFDEPTPVRVACPPRLMLPHVTTIDSVDWERNICDNDAPVPTYSEAILIDNDESTRGFSRPPECLLFQGDSRTRYFYSNLLMAQEITQNQKCNDLEPVHRRPRSQTSRDLRSFLKLQIFNRRSWNGWSSKSNNLEEGSEPCVDGYASEPPCYSDALHLPVLTRLRRSLTERSDIWRRTFQHRRGSDVGQCLTFNTETKL